MSRSSPPPPRNSPSIGEHILVTLARLLSRSQIAHSMEMKEALRDPSKEFAYRAREFGRLTEAVVRFQIPIAGRIVLDVGCNHGALTAGLPSLGAREVIGVDVDAGAIKRAKAHEHRREGADCH